MKTERHKQISGCCPIERRYKVSSGKMNMTTGETTIDREWTTIGPCNVPLFGRDLSRGCCSSCAELHSTELNTITDRGLEQLAELLG